MRRDLTLLAWMMLASSASAQLCAPNVMCAKFGTPFNCESNPCSVNVLVGQVCKEPWAPDIAVDACLAVAGACCNCIKPGALNCNAMLTDSNTVQIFVQSDLGLTSLEPNLQNASASIYGFQPGTRDSVIVIATKIDPTSWARVELQVCDSGQCLTCDPVVALVVREAGKPVRETFSRLQESDGQVTVYNGNPGLRTLQITVNGKNFRIVDLRDGEEQTLDVSFAMLPGEGNIITLTGMGKPGSSATMMIHD